jgi:glutathione S-transferase
MIKLYHNDMSSCAQKVRLVLAEKGLSWAGHHLKLRDGPQFKPEYLKLNPMGVVPTLIDDGQVIIESTLIMEYLDEAYPTPPLRPSDPVGKVHMRLWTKQLDEGLHAATGTISSCVAFRYQHIDTKPTLDKREAYYAKIPDPVKRARQRDVIENGMSSKFLPDAVRRFRKLYDEMEATLTESTWLAGDAYTLADVAYTPYLTRFEHLQLLDVLQSRPNLANWYERIKSRKNYAVGIGEWLSNEYLILMRQKGLEARKTFMDLFNDI